MTSAAKGLNVADLLEAPGLTSSLRDRLQAADANGDGVISASEMIDVIQSEITATRDRKVMQRVLVALGIACLLIIAAVVGLTYAVVEMSKDTSVQNNVLVGKDGLQPLSTATLQKTVQLADLYKASSPSELDWLTHVTVPFGKGEAVLKIQNVYLVPGERARFDTAAENVSVEVTADGVSVSGDEQAPGGRRRLMQENEASAGGTSVVDSSKKMIDPLNDNFYKEGNTIKCPNAKVGDQGTFDGVKYTKVNRDVLNNLISVTRGLVPPGGGTHPLTTVCTSDVTDMSGLFKDATAFNSPIDRWDTSKVTNMQSMFEGATSFNQDISEWNTAAVMSMRSMFQGANSFNQPIGKWNTAAVTSMRSMFEGATSFNQDISKWNTAAVTSMLSMFKDATSFNQPIGNWNTAAVKSMGEMFYEAKEFNQPIGNWNTVAVTSMSTMFYYATSFNQPIGNWNMAAVTDMSFMFYEAKEFNQPIGNWNMAAVTDMSFMFSGATSFNQPIGNWNTAKVGSMNSMFRGAKDFSQNISSWNVRYLDSGYRFCLNFCQGAGEITPPEFEKSPSTKKPLCGDPQCPEKKA